MLYRMGDFMNIVKIEYVKNVRIMNLHNDMVFPLQNILKIHFEDGSFRVIDLFSEKDMTNIDYYKVLETPRTKYKTLMEDESYYDSLNI